MPSYPDTLIKSILRSVKTIAMVGASANEIRPSYFAMMYLLNKGYKVIPVNPGPNPAHQPPSPERVDAFVARLVELGVVTLVRRPRGRDVGGACGQLAGALRHKRGSDLFQE